MQGEQSGNTYRRGLILGFAIPFFSPVLLGIWAWGIGAIYFSNLPGQLLQTVAAWGFALAFPVALLILRNRLRTLIWFAAAFVVILVWWLAIQPSHDRDWRTEVAILPYAEIRNDVATVHNVRDFDYRTEDDFTVRYYDKTYRLSDLQTVDLILSYWDDQIAVAHVLLSFGFRDGTFLVVSVETRVEKGEPQDGLRGLFKQYELIYVLADERDIIRLRTTFRKEDVFVYPTRTTPDQARALFLGIIKTVNEIHKTPQWYNTVEQNCAFSLITHLQAVTGVRNRDIRQLFVGFGDKLAYDRGWIDTQKSFAATKATHYVNQYLSENPDPATFSEQIRSYRR